VNYNNSKNYFFQYNDKIFTLYSHHDCAVVGGPTTSPNKSKMAVLNFVKMVISLYWIQISSHNFIKTQHRQTTDNICKMAFSLHSRKRSVDNF